MPQGMLVLGAAAGGISWPSLRGSIRNVFVDGKLWSPASSTGQLSVGVRACSRQVWAQPCSSPTNTSWQLNASSAALMPKTGEFGLVVVANDSSATYLQDLPSGSGGRANFALPLATATGYCQLSMVFIGNGSNSASNAQLQLTTADGRLQTYFINQRRGSVGSVVSSDSIWVQLGSAGAAAGLSVSSEGADGVVTLVRIDVTCGYEEGCG